MYKSAVGFRTESQICKEKLATVAELADAKDLGSFAREGVPVQVGPVVLGDRWSMSYVQSISEFLKLRPIHLAACAIVAGAMLFLPDQVRERLSIVQLTEDYRPHLGVALLVAVVFIVVHVTKDIADWISHAMSRRKAIKRIAQYLHRLTEHEKEVLWLYLSEQTKTQTFAAYDGVVNGLVAHGILYCAAEVGPFASFDYNVTDVAWRYLNDHLHLAVPEDVKCLDWIASECVHNGPEP